MNEYDVVVIGGGIAGVSIGYELASDRSVGLLEMESTLAFHTTGRSAAMFLESYGGPTARLLTSVSRRFFEDPPAGFERALLSPSAMLWVGSHGTAGAVERLAAEAIESRAHVQFVSAAEIAEIAPVVRPDWVESGLLEPGACTIDVAALHAGYVAGLRRRGGDVNACAEVAALNWSAGRWTLTDRSGREYRARIVVNATGAWCDRVAALAGVVPVGIRPLRRTVFMVAAPPTLDMATFPFVSDISNNFYLKPEGAQILCSPADETASEPCDAHPEEIDIARAIDHINAATTLNVRHVRSAWAGLRSFVADRSPVACFDDGVDGYFWFVGQGGVGIQIAPAFAMAAAALVRRDPLPDELARRGLSAAMLGRARIGQQPEAAG